MKYSEMVDGVTRRQVAGSQEATYLKVASAGADQPGNGAGKDEVALARSMRPAEEGLEPRHVSEFLHGHFFAFLFPCLRLNGRLPYCCSLSGPAMKADERENRARARGSAAR